MYLLGVLVVATGIALAIALHEVGHLLPAKIFGVKVTQYMVGFGPTLWSRRIGETEYGVKAVPLGGFVRMIGMFPPGKDGRVRAGSSNPFHSLVEEARQESLIEVQPGDEDRVFYRLPVWQKIIVMLGGPLVNLVLSALMVTALLCLHGVAGPAVPTLSSISPCAPTDVTATDCTGQPASPAAAAGLEVGDTIVSVDGTPVSDWASTTRAIQQAGDDPVELVVERDGEERTVTADLVLRERPVVGEDGQVEVDAAGDPVMEEVGFLGASPSISYVPQPISEVPGVVGQMATDTATLVLRLPQKLVDVAQAAFGTEERDAEGPMSVVGVGRVAGEVAGGALGGMAPSLGDKMWILLSLLASLNMALFVFNMVPLLPLDGGHIAGALWEGLRKLWARVRGLPDPGPVDTAKALPLAYGVALVLLGMTVLLVYADIFKPISLG